MSKYKYNINDFLISSWSSFIITDIHEDGKFISVYNITEDKEDAFQSSAVDVYVDCGTYIHLPGSE